jgi:ribonuclease HI
MTTSPSPDTLAALIGAAFHNERVAARRMAAREGVDEAEALRRVMAQSATAQGLAGLADLLAARARLKRDEAERRAAKLAARSEKVAAMKARAQPAPQPGAWQAWFDGSAHPNPGRLGIGGLLLGPAGERIEISERAGHGNSGEAEYLALVALLEAAVAARPGVLAIYGDSQVVIGDVAGGMGAAGGAGAAGLEQHRERALDLLAQLGKSGRVTLHWVPRHRNGEADRLSQQAIASWAGLD